MLTVNRILILIAVDILGDNSHGNHVGNLIVNTTGKHETLRRGVYVTLHAMRDRGWLDQWIAGDKTPRPFYSLTKLGREVLDAQLKEFRDIVAVWDKAQARRLRKEIAA